MTTRRDVALAVTASVALLGAGAWAAKELGSTRVTLVLTMPVPTTPASTARGALLKAPLLKAPLSSTRDLWAVTPVLAAYRPTSVVLRVADPARVQVPALGVDSAIVPLGLQPDGTMDVPADYDTAGWYTGGPAPGATGPAVIAAHLDSETGPAVFYKLQDLRPDAVVHVPRTDGKRSTFVVTRVARYPKDAFPTHEVFGPTNTPELRLITCGGDFDFARHSYGANVVVYARLR